MTWAVEVVQAPQQQAAWRSRAKSVGKELQQTYALNTHHHLSHSMEDTLIQAEADSMFRQQSVV